MPRRVQAASFDVDAQKTFSPFCPAELPVPEGDHIVPGLNRPAELAGWRWGSKDAHSPKAVWMTQDPTLIGQRRNPASEIFRPRGF